MLRPIKDTLPNHVSLADLEPQSLAFCQCIYGGPAETRTPVQYVSTLLQRLQFYLSMFEKENCQCFK